MPRFYFDTSDNDRQVRDEDGLDLPDELSARNEAIKVLPGMAADGLPDGPEHLFRVSVRDANGEYIFEASLNLMSHWVSRKP